MLSTICINCIFMQSAHRQIDTVQRQVCCTHRQIHFSVMYAAHREIQFSIMYAAYKDRYSLASCMLHIDRYNLASCMLHTQIDIVQRQVCCTHRQIQFSVMYAAHIDRYSLASCMLHIDRYSLASCNLDIDTVQRHVCCTAHTYLTLVATFTFKVMLLLHFASGVHVQNRIGMSECMLNYECGKRQSINVINK